MSTKDFDTARELAQFVTDQAITPANTIIREKDGRWWLFWW